MKPTDEDVEAARLAGMPVSSRTFNPVYVEFDLRAALEAYTPRLIERLAREADEVSATIEYGDSEDGGVFEPLSDWLRSFVEKNHD